MLWELCYNKDHNAVVLSTYMYVATEYMLAILYNVTPTYVHQKCYMKIQRQALNL